MKNTILIAILLLLVNCKPKADEVKTSNNSDSLKRVWMLVEFKKFSKADLMSKKCFLDMTQNEVATANMGCNGISINYKLKSESDILFSDGMRTEMACGEMQIEEDFLEIVPKIRKYKIEGHKLTLMSNDEINLVFVAQDWD